MQTWEHFPNAPIIEAILDIRFEPASDANWKLGASDFPQLADSHPIVEQQYAMLYRAHWSDEKPPTQESLRDVTGIRFRNDREVIQFRIDGFTFSMLYPYSSWKQLLEEAWGAWKEYRTLVQGGTVIRLGVRYVNRMKFPKSSKLGTFLVAPPQLPAQLNFPIREFFTSHEVELAGQDSMATITQTVESESGVDVAYILDIDTFQNVSLASGDERMKASFEMLHDFKNEIFFSLITEEAKKLWR